MPEGVVRADKVLDALEEMREGTGLDETMVAQWSRDSAMERRYRQFINDRKGKEERVRNWSYEKFRFYHQTCQGRSLVTGMAPRTHLDIDRVIDTDGYDMDTILIMESELNYAKASMEEYKDHRAFIESGQVSKAKWAANRLRNDLVQFVKDAKPRMKRYVFSISYTQQQRHLASYSALITQSFVFEVG